MKPEVYKRTDGLWDWRLRHENGQIVATSGGQGFTERNDAIEAIIKVVGDVAAEAFTEGDDLA